MNRLHHWYCNREAWKRHVREDLVPEAIADVDLGPDVLEVGPGFGPATEVLATRARRVTALEIDPVLAGPLRERMGGGVEVVEGDGTDMPFEDATLHGAACFTMLHHVPSATLRTASSRRSGGCCVPVPRSRAPTAPAAGWGSR